MRLTVDLENALSVVRALLLFNFHAVAGSLCTLNVEENVAVVLAALYACSYLTATFTAYDTSLVEFREVHFVHLDWRSWCDNWPLHPHTAAVVNPVIKRICYWRRSQLKLSFISLNKIAVVFWDVMVLFFMLVIL